MHVEKLASQGHSHAFVSFSLFPEVPKHFLKHATTGGGLAASPPGLLIFHCQ